MATGESKITCEAPVIYLLDNAGPDREGGRPGSGKGRERVEAEGLGRWIEKS